MTSITKRVGVDVFLLLVFLAALALWTLLSSVAGCQPPVPVCEPAAARCNGTDRVEVCTPEGQWLAADVCSDFGPGEWECGTAEGGVVACYPRKLVDPR